MCAFFLLYTSYVITMLIGACNQCFSPTRVVEFKFERGKNIGLRDIILHLLHRNESNLLEIYQKKDEPDKTTDRLQNNIISLSPDVSDQCNGPFAQMRSLMRNAIIRGKVAIARG